MKKIAILGSTGSIGKSALNVVRHLSPKLKVVAISAKENIDLLEEQAKEFNPQLIAVYNKEKALELQKRLPQMKVVGGAEGLEELACLEDSDMVLSAMSGFIGILPTIAAIKKKKQIALANKEVLVSAGEYVMRLAKAYDVPILPVDSEHNALFQCLLGEKTESIHRLIITASGGPFLKYSPEQLKEIDTQSALNHPTWRMGPKITVDSSTLMNKGLEVIEAHHLFGVAIDKIEVVIHPQSVIHSMAEMVDGSMLAMLSAPNMQLPIQYALTYPERYPYSLPFYDFRKYPSLDFSFPDQEKFRCLALSYEALRIGGTMPCFMNAANEVLVNRFLKGEIHWLEIASKLEQLMSRHNSSKSDNLEIILEIDAAAREVAIEI